MRIRSRTGTFVASKRSPGRPCNRIPLRSRFGLTDDTSNAGISEVCASVTVLSHAAARRQNRTAMSEAPRLMTVLLDTAATSLPSHRGAHPVDDGVKGGARAHHARRL